MNGDTANGDAEYKTKMAGGDDVADKRINQFGDYNNERLTISAWNKRWAAGQTRFHMPKVHPLVLTLFTNLQQNQLLCSVCRSVKPMIVMDGLIF